MHNICKKTISIIFAVYLIAFLSAPCLAFGPSSQNIYQGIDVSHWQGDIDFSAVKNSGISIVYMKTSEEKSFIDPNFEKNYEMAKANNLKVGFYHYVTAQDVDAAKEQAIFFARVIAGKSPDCKLAMDFEDFGSLSLSEINEISKVFLETLEKETNSKALIYSNSYSARNIFSEELTKYPLWVANYNVSSPSENGKWDAWVRLAIHKYWHCSWYFWIR